MTSHTTRIIDKLQLPLLSLLAVSWLVWFVVPFTLFMPKTTAGLVTLTALVVLAINKFASTPAWKLK